VGTDRQTVAKFLAKMRADAEALDSARADAEALDSARADGHECFPAVRKLHCWVCECGQVCQPRRVA
jgi:hypothetical protein